MLQADLIAKQSHGQLLIYRRNLDFRRPHPLLLIPLLINDRGVLQHGLLSENADHEIDRLFEGEDFILRHELAFLKHLDVEYVIDQAYEQVYLGYDNHDDAALGLVEDAAKQAFEKHERGAKRCPELVRERQLIQTESLVLLLLEVEFRTQLQRLNVVRDVVQVDGRCMLLQELDALDADLEELLFVPALLQLEHAVLLVWFVLLRHDNLLERDRILVI